MVEEQLTVTDSDKKPERPTAYCVACKHEIPLGASVCATCKSYQHNWMNYLQYAAGMTAAILFAASALAWLSGQVRALFYRDDVRLIAANSLDSAVIGNFGDGAIFVSHLSLFMTGRTTNWTSRRVTFNTMLPVGQFLKGEFLPKPTTEKYVYLRGLTTDEFDRRLTVAVSDESCFEIGFFSASDPTFQELRQIAGSALNTFDVSGRLEYWNTRQTAPLYMPIHGYGILGEYSKQDCVSKFPIPFVVNPAKAR